MSPFRSDRRLTDRLIGTVGLAFILAVGPGGNRLAAQACERPQSATEAGAAINLVVKLQTFLNGNFMSDGAGVVVGMAADTMFLATAAHVVYDIDVQADSIEAYFFSGCLGGLDPPQEAEVCSDVGRPIDIALLCVWVPPNVVRPKLNRLGPESVDESARVRPVGCPLGECWGVAQPDRVLAQDSLRILFTTFFVSTGHSGGALFNDWNEVAGIVTNEGQPFSSAVPIQTVLRNLCARGPEDEFCPRVQLGRPYTPRGGYGLSIGFMHPMLGIGTEEQNLGLGPDPDRTPSGRIIVQYRATSRVAVHAGALRLIPESLSVSAAMLGAGITLSGWEGRVSLYPFVEGGFGHVEARFDTGGYFVQGAGGNVYVPFWENVESDGLGFGLGVSGQIIVAPRFILEGVGGVWRFNRPENAPELPLGFFGFGFRVGA